MAGSDKTSGGITVACYQATGRATIKSQAMVMTVSAYLGTGKCHAVGRTNSATAPILLGVNPGSNGTYNLSGSGLLSGFHFRKAVGYSAEPAFSRSRAEPMPGC